MYSNTRYILYLVALSIVRAGRLFDEVFFQYQVPVQNYASLSCDHGVDHVRQPQHSVRGISNHFVYLFFCCFYLAVLFCCFGTGAETAAVPAGHDPTGGVGGQASCAAGG